MFWIRAWMLLKKVKQYLSLIVPFRLVDDHGPRLGHLDGRVIGDCDERGPFSNIFVASLEATPKAVSPPFTSASSAQLSTLRRRRGIRCSGLVTLALPATACHTFSARVLHPPASRPREGCHPSSSAGCCAPPHQFSSGLRSGLPSSSQRRVFPPYCDSQRPGCSPLQQRDLLFYAWLPWSGVRGSTQ